MNVLILGKNGQLGHAVQILFPKAKALDRSQLDLIDLDAVERAIYYYRPDVLINAAAYTSVDKAESEPALAFRINVEAVDVIAKAMRQHNGWLIHYSTDYVFAGMGDLPHREDDTTAPLNTYGETKWLGEEAIRASKVQHFILRTSWVYSAYGHNFARTILRLAKNEKKLRVVDDQCGAPTHANLLARLTHHAVHNRHAIESGTYHACASGTTSWHGFATYLLTQARICNLPLQTQLIEAVHSHDHDTIAKRPLNSRLDCHKLEREFSLRLPHWHEDASTFVTDYIRKYHEQA